MRTYVRLDRNVHSLKRKNFPFFFIPSFLFSSFSEEEENCAKNLLFDREQIGIPWDNVEEEQIYYYNVYFHAGGGLNHTNDLFPVFFATKQS